MRRTVACGAPLVAISVAMLGTSSPAAAYVRSRVEKDGGAFYWKTSCVPATIYTNGFEDAPGGFTVDKVAKSVAAAAHAWSPDEVTCPGAAGGHPYLEIVPTLSQQEKPPAIAWDSKNSIVIRTDAWSKSGTPGMEYEYGALALTTVTARGDGHIVDADIEINAITKNWLDLDPGVTVPPGQATFAIHDLQNTLTHEFGHFLGLDHTCYSPQSTKLRPLDDQGQPVPDCDGAPPAVAMTVMFDRADELETSKRVLSDDDKRAVCEIYDSASDPRICDVDQPHDGCAIAAPARRGGATGARVLGSLVAGALAFAAARRRERSSSSG